MPRFRVSFAGVTNMLTDAFSRGLLRRFFELCTYADHTPTSIIRCNLDFSDVDTAGARWPCEDVGAQLLAGSDVRDILAQRQVLPSEEIASWLPSTPILDPDVVRRMVGDQVARHIGHLDRDGIGSSEWHGAQAGAAEDACMQRSAESQGPTGRQGAGQ